MFCFLILFNILYIFYIILFNIFSIFFINVKDYYLFCKLKKIIQNSQI